MHDMMRQWALFGPSLDMARKKCVPEGDQPMLVYLEGCRHQFNYRANNAQDLDREIKRARSALKGIEKELGKRHSLVKTSTTVIETAEERSKAIRDFLDDNVSQVEQYWELLKRR